MMGTVTYPEPAVADTINQYFVPVQVNTQEEQGKPIVERYRQVWTPDIRIVGHDGFDYYYWNGYLPPFDFLPQLLAGIAHTRMRMQDDPGAATMYKELLRRFPTSPVAPEAQYWLAVARYKDSHEGKDLVSGWRELRLRYPTSPWRSKQLFFEEQ